MFDGKAFGKEVVAAVKTHVDKSLAPLFARLDAMDAKMAEMAEEDLADLQAVKTDIESLRKAIAALPEPIEPPALPDIPAMITEAVAAVPVPQDGKSIDPAEVKAMVDEAVAALPVAQDGKDADPELMAQQVKEAAEAILAGWERPQDGKSVSAEELQPIIEERVKRAVAAIPVPKDGKDGEPGKDGRDALDAVEFLRSTHGNLIVTLSNGTTKDLGPIDGKDGTPGKDGDAGRDGFGFDDLEVVETEKGVFMIFKRGDDVKEFRLPIVIDRGVFKEGTYQRGDGVSFGGSFWIAQEETADKPGEGKGWRLAVKRGRDGKDGQMKDPPKSGPVKVG